MEFPVVTRGGEDRLRTENFSSVECGQYVLVVLFARIGVVFPLPVSPTTTTTRLARIAARISSRRSWAARSWASNASRAACQRAIDSSVVVRRGRRSLLGFTRRSRAAASERNSASFGA